jgi:hypothetical protein
MGDMDAVWPDFPRGALRQAAQGELAHGEGGREGEALHARGRAGQQDGAATMRQHAPGCLLHDQEAPEGGDGNRLPDASDSVPPAAPGHVRSHCT